MVSYEELKALGVKQSPHRIRQMIREGKFPRPVKGSKGKVFQWRESDVKSHIKKKTPAT
jgi:predicted DNA-binding transcriptional regulator AlpA